MRESVLMVEATDQFGRVESEPVKIESWDGGRVVRMVRDDGSSEVWDGAELRAALEPKQEPEARAA